MGLGRSLKKIGKKALKATFLGGPIFGQLAGLKESLKAGRLPDQSAANTRARIAREQWEDYKSRFQPLEDTLLGYVQNKGNFSDSLKTGARRSIQEQFGSATGMAERRLSSYGLTMPQEQKQRFQRQVSYDKNLAEVGAMNQIDRFADDQLYTILGGGLARRS